jgi:hypothetical protein
MNNGVTMSMEHEDDAEEYVEEEVVESPRE